MSNFLSVLLRNFLLIYRKERSVHLPRDFLIKYQQCLCFSYKLLLLVKGTLGVALITHSVYIGGSHVVAKVCPHIRWQISRWPLFHGSKSTYRTNPCQSSWKGTWNATLNVTVHRRADRFLFTRPSSTIRQKNSLSFVIL